MAQQFGSDIKWIYAQKINDGEWVARYVTAKETPTPLDECRMLDETPMGQFSKSAFAIFKNRENWQDYNPRNLLDYRSKKDAPIVGLGGLIGSLPADYF